MKKLITLLSLTAMLATATNGLQAQEYGTAYESSRKAPAISPTIVLGTIALVAVIAVLVQNSHHHHHAH